MWMAQSSEPYPHIRLRDPICRIHRLNHHHSGFLPHPVADPLIEPEQSMTIAKLR